MEKNYYRILGIGPKATPRDIRDAYRKRAKELHPDHYGENSSPFLEVQEAYGVLGDPGSRRRYDKSRRSQPVRTAERDFPRAEPLRPNRPQAEPIRAAAEPFLPDIIDLRHSFRSGRPSMEEVFDRIRDSFGSAVLYKGERLRGLSLEIVLTPREARTGGRFRILVPAVSPCPACGGRGLLPPYNCYRCMGSGSVSEDVPVVVNFYPGIPDGYQKSVSLGGLGIRDIFLTLLFRIGGAYPDVF